MAGKSTVVHAHGTWHHQTGMLTAASGAAPRGGAGVGFTPPSKTEDGFEMQFGVNHLAHFALFLELKDLLLKSATPSFRSRVVSVASDAHLVSAVRFDDISFETEEYDNVCTPFPAVVGLRTRLLVAVSGACTRRSRTHVQCILFGKIAASWR